MLKMLVRTNPENVDEVCYVRSDLVGKQINNTRLSILDEMESKCHPPTDQFTMILISRMREKYLRPKEQE